MNARLDEKLKLGLKITKEWADKGYLIEGGWKGLVYIWDLDKCLPVQQSEMRKAFYAGAQHLYASIMATLDQGEEATTDDLKRMDLIHAELGKFAEEMLAQAKQ
jgi:hypothetical protein